MIFRIEATAHHNMVLVDKDEYDALKEAQVILMNVLEVHEKMRSGETQWSGDYLEKMGVLLDGIVAPKEAEETEEPDE